MGNRSISKYLFVTALFGAATAHAAPGDLDTTFGTAGKVILDLNNGSNDLSRSIALDASGNFYLGGSSSKTGVDFAVARFLSNGNLDTTLGTAGKTIVDVGTNTTESGGTMALDTSGNVYISGTTASSGPSQFAVVRLNHTGAVDNGFGVNGRALVASNTPNNESCCGITITSTGSIFLAGATVIATQRTMKVAKFTSAGQPDGTFGNGGIALALFRNSTNGVAAIPDASGNVHVAASVGTNTPSVNIDMALIVFGSTGQIATGFGNMGASYADNAAVDASSSMARDKAGNFYIAGRTTAADHTTTVTGVAKFDKNGTLVPAFGTNGIKAIGIPGAAAGISNDVQIDGDGNLYLTGFAIVGGKTLTSIIELDGMSGETIPGFGTNGVATIDISGGLYSGQSAVLDPAHNRICATAERDDFTGLSDFTIACVITTPVNEIFAGSFEPQ